MNSSITIFVEAEIPPGKCDALKQWISRFVAHSEATEPNLLAYNWYIDEAGSQLRIVERHADSDSVVFHSGNVAELSGEINGLREIRKITVLGSVNDQLRKGLESAGAELVMLVDGFTR